MINRRYDIEVSNDNAAALHMDRNGSETAWQTRHISVKALWLHQLSRRGIKFTYQPTSEMAADSITKRLGASRLPQIKEDLSGFVSSRSSLSQTRSMWFSSTSFALSCEYTGFKLFQCLFFSIGTPASIAPAPAPSKAPAPAASSSSAPDIPVKAAPTSKNPSMASAPRNAPCPAIQGADPMEEHKPRSH